MRRRVAVGAIAGLLVALAGCASAALGAVAAVQDDRLPTLTTAAQIDQRVALLAATGARVTRVDLFWSDIARTRPANPTDPADPAYDFSRADEILSALHARGITPIVCVYSSPAWAAAGHRGPAGQQFNPYAPDPVQFGKFMQAVAARYSGAFPRPGAQYDGAITLLPRVRHFELWNEPNLQLFLRPQFAGRTPVSLRTYTAMVRAAVPRIRSENPRAVIIVGAAGPKSSTDASGIGALQWLKGIRDARPKLRFDAYSQHIYPAAPPRTAGTAVPSWSSLRTLLAAVSGIRRGMPLYITEAGYTTATTRYRRVKVSAAQQATYLRDIYALPLVRSPRVPVVVWFNLQDNRDWPGGLYRVNRAAKPSLARFRAITAHTVLPAALTP